MSQYTPRYIRTSPTLHSLRSEEQDRSYSCSGVVSGKNSVTTNLLVLDGVTRRPLMKMVKTSYNFLRYKLDDTQRVVVVVPHCQVTSRRSLTGIEVTRKGGFSRYD